MVEKFCRKMLSCHYELFVLSPKEEQLESVDGRIVDDIHTMTEVSANMLDAVLGKVISLFSFAVMLYQISPALVVVLVFYSMVSTVFLSGYFGKSLAQLNAIRSDLVKKKEEKAFFKN